MTAEEKAKAYDEALERARKQKYDYQKELDKTDKSSQLAGLLRAGISAIDMVFPELAESEDEKTRKELLEEIESIIPHEDETDSEGLILPSYHTRIDRYKSYLEKQKEYELTEEDKKIIPEALVMLCDDIINHRVHTPIKTDEEGARKIKAFLKTFNRQPYKTREEWEKQNLLSEGHPLVVLRLADVEEGRGEVVRMTHIIWRINNDRKRQGEEYDA